MDKSTSWTESIPAREPEARIGSYRVLGPIGTGGMSSVFRAVHVETNQQVALKVLTRSLAKNATLLQRFLREARSAETLEHPNIVAIYDRGVDSGRHYLVLEYVAGGDFHDYILKRGPLSLAEAVTVVKSVAEGLKYAANRGLIHRDVKPSNILRSPEGVIKLIDLGLALQNEFEDERVTRDGTTVGTVDYMAPEQARDSRGTSIQSDMYSLGCTFYFLLAGVAPFPGGDITDKLTRHAKNPPPDVRDLRPDLPAELSAILLRLMAKRPEDRFATYDDLIAAIDAVPMAGANQPPGITLAPLLEQPGVAPEGYDFDATQIHKHNTPHSNGSAEASFPLVSLVELAAEERAPAARDHSLAGSGVRERPVTERLASHAGGAAGLHSRDLALPVTASPSKQSIPAMAWIIPAGILCLAFLILGIGVAQFMGSNDGAEADAGGLDAVMPVDPDAALRQPAAASAGLGADERERRTMPAVSTKSAAPALVKWDEPADDDPPVTGPEPRELPAAAAAKYLPDWARSSAPLRIDGPHLIVRRITDSTDPAIVPNLHRALDGHNGGTVELADEGPFLADDLRFTGERRLIRARNGLRPIVRIDRTNQDAVRKQAAVFVLDHKSLVLDGIDLIVDARDLSRTQTAVFSCTGANLTLRNCSITILNHVASMKLSLVRTEAASPRTPSLVRLEGCLVRGAFTDGFRLSGGPCDVVLRDSVVVARGGPLVRFDGPTAAPECRVFVVRSLVAGPGPIVELTAETAADSSKPLSIHAFGSVFGRLHGAGVASVIAANDAIQPPAKLIDWSGDENLFAGWTGFFASGDDRTVNVTDVEAARSTWNGTDVSSREIGVEWAHLGDLAGAAATDFASDALGYRAILERAARPRAGLYEKAVAAYSDPAVPEPGEWTFHAVDQTMMITRPGNNSGLLPPHMTDPLRMGMGAGITPPPGSTAARELIFRTEDAGWGGDLGLFLQRNLQPAFHFVRVRVVGSGAHRFTPVKVPSGLRLEIKVESTSQTAPPSWSPRDGATGTALIEVEGGALVLWNMILRHEKTAGLKHLIYVQDGHLVLSNCQLTAGMSAETAGDLIAFRAASTQPRPPEVDPPLFSFASERPVCRLAGCVLITGGSALQAELGHGLVALSQCAVAAGGPAIELKPANVARRRFVADLVLDHCTITAERAIIRAGAWPGQAPGPNRPWLITSRNCAFLGLSGRTTRETVLLRADGDALANGSVFWQADDDAADVDWFVSAVDAPPAANRARDVQQQWVQFWGHNHMGRVTGPRAGRGSSVRFRERLRAGQELGAADLTLDPAYHPDRLELSVGADVARLGIVPAAAVPARIPVRRQAATSTVPF
jgi:eukaryotic-like serine/threonine-protein kinase